VNTQIYWLHTLSPTHIGTGRGVGYIDLPIHRDPITGWPLVPGSAFKGVWSDHFGATDAKRASDRKLGLAFGRASDSTNQSSSAGALVPTDARLVCLPIRSIFGTFAWCTSPLALHMLQRDLHLAGMTSSLPQPPNIADGAIHVTQRSKLHLEKKKVYLEDLDFDVTPCPSADGWAEMIAERVFGGDHDQAWRDLFRERFAIVTNTTFDFLAETGTEVVARVRIDDDKKTVVPGALWNEEALPPETILAGLIACDRVFAGDSNGVTASDLIQEYATKPLSLQIGGKATIGRGQVRCVFGSVGDRA
jgi:CRISPR-associated protein Cmr4